jgi:Kef-type K+ transport system membrane component KefB
MFSNNPPTTLRAFATIALALALALALVTATASAIPFDAGADARTDASSSELSDASATPLDAGPGDARDAGAALAREAFPESPAPQQAVPKEERPELLLRTVLGLLAVLALAYIGGHRRVRRLEETLGIHSLIAGGFPFVALGLIAKHPSVGAISDVGLATLGPLIEFALGWLGFLVGLRFDLRAAEKLPKRLGTTIGLETALPFAVAALTCGALVAWLGDSSVATAAARSGVLLGIAAAMSTPQSGTSQPSSGPAHVLAKHLDEVVGVLGLALVAVLFRPARVELAWELPGTVWLFLAVGMGATLGVLAYVLLRRTISGAESIAIVLGSVAFTGGMAAYVSLPPIVVCFVAGLVLANAPGARKEELRKTLGVLERPIYLVFLFVAGALWDPGDWRGWALLFTFVASRLVGLSVAARASRPAEVVSGPFAPLSVVSIAVAVSAQSLYQSPALPWMMTAVIGGAMVSEVLAQVASRTARGRLNPAPQVESVGSLPPRERG